MTATEGNRCKYCWHKPQGWGDKFHNEGCPDVLHLNRGNSVEEEAKLTLKAKAQWETGYAYGFDDNVIEHWRYPNYSHAFILGYRVGKAEIDQLVEEAWQANQRYGEYL